MSIAVDPTPRSDLVTTVRQDLTTALLGAWITVGGFVDGFAHRNLDTPETFFTPWHGVLYSGCLASAFWVLWLVVSNRERAGSLVEAIPVGYRVTVAGVVVFAAGGLGDLFWHTIFGVEVSIDALLSPTHIMLLLGAVLILAGPLRARWWDTGYDPNSLAVFWPPVIAVTAIAAELGFFFQYMDGLSARFMQVTYVPGLETGYYEVVAGLSSMLVTTVIVMGGLLLVMRRWTLPRGTALFFFAIYGLLMEWLEGFTFPEDLIAPLAGGLVAEMLLWSLRPGAVRLGHLRWFAFAVPFAMWSVRFIVFEQFSDINWPVEVWTGALAFSGLAGVGLSLLAFAPMKPGHISS